MEARRVHLLLGLATAFLTSHETFPAGPLNARQRSRHSIMRAGMSEGGIVTGRDVGTPSMSTITSAGPAGRSVGSAK